MIPPLPALVFDADGTLLDIHSAVRRHAARLAVVAESVSALWRQRQLEYSWVLSATGDYEDFAILTERALDLALAQHGVRDAELRAALLGAYRPLDPFPDAGVYRLAVTTLGLGVRDIAFVSANAWDAHGAARFGFRTVWLNRASGPPEYGLERRATVIRSLEAVP